MHAVGAAALAIVAWAAGGIVCRGLPPVRGAERVVLRAYAGATAVATAVLVVGSVSLKAAWYLTAIAALGVVLRTIWRWRKGAGTEPRIGGGPASRFASLNLGVVIAANLLAAIAVLAPITSWDAGVAHLAVPAAHARAGVIGLDEGNVYSAYPQLLHAVFAVSYSVDGERGVAAIGWMLCVLSCCAVYALGKRAGGEIAGAVAAALFASSPIYSAQAGTVAIDVPFAGFVAGSLVALLTWSESKNLHVLLVSGLIAGAACGIRHTGYLVIVFLALWIVTAPLPARWRSLSVFAASAAFASAPWWLRSWLLVGNPLYPLLTGVFGDGGIPDVQVTAPLQHETARAAGVIDALTFPWRILMHPDQFDGWQASPGGLTLALGVVGVLVGGPVARRLGAFSLGGIVAIYMVQRLARYLLPFFMPLHVLSGVAVARLQPLRKPIAALLAFSYIYGLLLAAGMMHFKLPAAIGLESREDYLTRRVERYPAFAWANRNLREDATVLTLDPRGYYLRPHTFTNLAALARIANKSPEDQLAWMKRHEIRYILVPEAYVEASPVFREWGITPLIASWRSAPDRFVPVYDAPMADVRSGGVERVTIYEVVWGDAGAHP